MPSFAAPGFLLAGSLLALVPLALHLLARRPPERSPLPTARFLNPDPRTKLGLRRRPDHLLLLVLRMVFLLFLGAALAGPTWIPASDGTVRIVLLDGGTEMAGVWSDAVAAAVEEMAGAGDGAGLLVAFPSGAAIASGELTAARIDSLREAGPAAARPADYLDALRLARRTAEGSTRFDSVEVRLVTLPRWDAWGPAMHPLRPAIWPGRIEVVALEPEPRAPVPDPAPPPPPAPVRLHHAPGEGRFVKAALLALGREVVDAGEAPPPSPGEGPGAQGGAGGRSAADADPSIPAVHVFVGSEPGRDFDRILEEALEGARSRGDTVVLAGIALDGIGEAQRAAVPWVAAPAPGAGGGEWELPRTLRLEPGGEPVPGVHLLPGLPASGAQVPLLRDEGWAAAAALPAASPPRAGEDAGKGGGGCVVYLAALPEAGALPGSSRYPDVWSALLLGCRGKERFHSGAAIHEEGEVRRQPSAAARLDSTALGLLSGGDLPARVATASLRAAAGPAGGKGLHRWLLAAALLTALVETLLAYAPARRRRE